MRGSTAVLRQRSDPASVLPARPGGEVRGPGRAGGGVEPAAVPVSGADDHRRGVHVLDRGEAS